MTSTSCGASSSRTAPSCGASCPAAQRATSCSGTPCATGGPCSRFAWPPPPATQSRLRRMPFRPAGRLSEVMSANSDKKCDRSAQVWNCNGVGGVVGVFNIQGASWDRKRRKFWIHDASPPSLSAYVCPNDVWDMRTSAVGDKVEKPVFPSTL